MAKLQMTSASEETRAAVGDSPVTLVRGDVPPSQLPPIAGIGTPETVRAEITDAYNDAQTFYQREPDDVIRLVSGHCSRLSSLRTSVGRYDGHPVWRKVRSELEECLEELRQQFQFHSRIIASRELDWKIETGGRQT